VPRVNRSCEAVASDSMGRLQGSGNAGPAGRTGAAVQAIAAPPRGGAPRWDKEPVDGAVRLADRIGGRAVDDRGGRRRGLDVRDPVTGPGEEIDRPAKDEQGQDRADD